MPAAVEKLGAPEKTAVVGNPVRPEVFEKAGADAIRAQLGAGDRTVILSFGGKPGARRVNEVVATLRLEQKEHKPVRSTSTPPDSTAWSCFKISKRKRFTPGGDFVVKETYQQYA